MRRDKSLRWQELRFGTRLIIVGLSGLLLAWVVGFMRDEAWARPGFAIRLFAAVLAIAVIVVNGVDDWLWRRWYRRKDR